MHYRFTRTAIPSNFGTARDYALKIAGYLQANHGMDIHVGFQVFSEARIAWTMNYESLQDWEENQMKINSDEAYMNLVAEAGDHFVEGSVQDSMLAFLD